MRKLISIFAFLAALYFVVFSGSQTALNPSTGSGDTVINFWGVYDLPEVYQPIISSFEKNNPGTRVVYKQFANLDEYHDVLIRQLEKDKGPDLFIFSGAKREQYFSHLNPTSIKHAEGFSPLVYADLSENNLLYGLPFWVDTLMLYYNKRYYPEGIPNQWYDFAELTRDINTGGIAMGRLDNLKYGWEILKTLFLQKNVTLAKVGRYNLYDTLEFFNRFAYPIDRYFNWNEKLNKDYPDDEVDSFVLEKVAAIAGYTSLYDNIVYKSGTMKGRRIIDKEDIGVASFPQFDTENPKYLAKYFALGVSIYSKNPNLAWEFAKELTSEANASYYHLATGRLPGRVIAETDEDSDIARVQKKQLIYSSVFDIPEESKAKIEGIVNRAVLDKRVLLDIIAEEL